MFRNERVIRKSARIIADAINDTIRLHNEGLISDEPKINSQLVATIRERINNQKIKGIKWEALDIPDRVRNSLEHQSGADILEVIHIESPNYNVSKGFLVQCKIEKNLDKSEVERLRIQCENMLHLSPYSYVFLYGETEVKIVPALAVYKSKKHPSDLYYRRPASFFELHFESFLGDTEIKSTQISDLKLLLNKYKARNLLYLHATAV